MLDTEGLDGPWVLSIRQNPKYNNKSYISIIKVNMKELPIGFSGEDWLLSQTERVASTFPVPSRVKGICPELHKD